MGFGFAFIVGPVSAIGDAAAAVASGFVVPAADSGCFDSQAAKKRHVKAVAIEIVAFIRGC